MRRLSTVLALTAIAVAAAAATGCAIVITPEDGRVVSVFSSGSVSGNGQIVRESRSVSASDGIEVSGSIAMQVRVGQATSLEVEGDSNLVPLIRTEMRDGALHVWLDRSVSNSSGLRVTYTTPSLGNVAHSGSGSLVIDGLNGPSLQLSGTGSGSTRVAGKTGSLNLQARGSGSIDAGSLQVASGNIKLLGSGSVTLGQVNGAQLLTVLDGSGSMRASGVVQQLTSTMTGSGSLHLDGLTAESANLSNTGSGSISATVTRTVDAQALSSGSITVRGNPAERRTNGRNIRFAG
jgi:hypothetical protein